MGFGNVVEPRMTQIESEIFQEMSKAGGIEILESKIHRYEDDDEEI